jgi:hypothetical protein
MTVTVPSKNEKAPSTSETGLSSSGSVRNTTVTDLHKIGRLNMTADCYSNEQEARKSGWSLADDCYTRVSSSETEARTSDRYSPDDCCSWMEHCRVQRSLPNCYAQSRRRAGGPHDWCWYLA